ncbi:MAG: potassium transporter Kup [Acidobacteriaceae bacterium]|nr:potassium transporter Kup [Acidobacteriaceae bacterium]
MHPSPRLKAGRLLPLTLTAVGVVYGDLGTSPLYSLRECFYGEHGVTPDAANVLGVLSLIIYSLVMVVSIKYIAIVMRADNQGEGGILALAALLPRPTTGRSMTPVLMLAGIFGASLLYGDGIITPAITVLGAVEGLKVTTPLFEPYVVVVTVAILIALFAIQKSGTDRIGKAFGPIMVVWFVTIAALGLSWIVTAPVVLKAFDPRYAVSFFLANGRHGFVVLGGVLLVLTGSEALYADMGHFGRRPIQIAWFALVLPALLLNYFGQGALLLQQPQAAAQPFFLLAPDWARLPLVIIATMAAIIASQALISGAFSLTRQAVQLGYSPRLEIEHTSSHEMGQVYVPQVNWWLMVMTIAVVIGFESSSALASAYGIAVTMTMVITAMLLHVVMLNRWKWPPVVAYTVTGIFLTIDLSFFIGNVLKILHGGWLTLVIGIIIFTLMTTWKRGRQILAARLTAQSIPIEDFVARVRENPPVRVAGTAVFMTAQPRGTPPALAHNLRYNKVLHDTVVVLSVQTQTTPYVDDEARVTVMPLGAGLFDVIVRYGFMENPNIPTALEQAHELAPALEHDVIYFLGRETIIVSAKEGMPAWREQLFVLLARNAQRATAFFHLPVNRVVELGVQVEM